MFTEELAIFARAASGDAGLGLKDLIGRRVGITQDYTYPSAFYRDVRIMKSVAASDEDLIRMLLARRVDYVLMNALPGSCASAATPMPPAESARWAASARMASGWHFQGQGAGAGERGAVGGGLARNAQDGSYASMLLRVDSE